ncbi:MAG TPA: histidine kinase [Bacteroidales bacterium]|nr:histidine kinase [Bacteroidales bacterium]
MKHPVLGNRTWFIVWWLVWLILAAGQSFLFNVVYGNFIWMSIADSVISLLIFSGMALSLWYPFNYFNTGEKSPFHLLSNLLFTGLITIAFWILLTNLILSAVYSDNNYYVNYSVATFPYRIASGVFLYILVILTYYLNISLVNLSEKNAREARLESIVKETELKMLRSQINPHFLFNSLNSISYLTISNPEKARDMVVKLSEFMRYALSRKDEQPVSMRSELENLRLYLEIEKVRFGDKLITEEIIQDECLDFMIPVMLLQPIYENAVKHGVYESTETVKITTTARISAGYIEIVISNNYSETPSSKKGTGTGLSNVRRRMELFYGNRADLKTKAESGIFSVMLYMPAD